MKAVAKEITCTQIRIPHALWLAIKHEAVDMDTSANSAVIALVEEALEARRAHSRKRESLSQGTLRAAS
jgi:hypothetical protein